MKWTRRELRYRQQYLTEVCHTTLDPMEPGVVRIHLVPPRDGAGPETPWLVILNGQEILPVTFSWAVLLSCFIRHLNVFDGRKIPPEEYGKLIRDTAEDMAGVYPFHRRAVFIRDLERIMETLIDVARGEEVHESIAPISIFDYAKELRAPHRMDLMVSAMTDGEGKWHCNQRCVHCYAAGQPLSAARELTTAQWKTVIDRLKEACVAQLTFTGGEPTLREDLPELVEYSRFFITRLNTNGILLSENMCRRLYDASLDNTQVTLYSMTPEVHQRLVGANQFEATLQGIKNVLKTGMSVSVNTPLCRLNQDYPETIRRLSEMGLRYFTCSGLIPTGAADTPESRELRLSEPELEDVLTRSFAYCAEHGLELQFTTPGLLSEEALRKAGATQIPSCGAGLSNMAVSPDGQVIPCQSWLHESLGSLLETPFDQIWDSERCRAIRDISAKNTQRCQLSRQEGGIC